MLRTPIMPKAESGSHAERARRIRLRRGAYLLPSLFTIGNVFFGFYAVVSALNGSFQRAAILIFIAGILDGLDGRIARLTGTESEFGREFDSLADIVTFGVAPALLSYAAISPNFGRLAWLIPFFYLVCGATRLARFNVQTHGRESRYFVGLPTPAAAGSVGALILFSHNRSIESLMGGPLLAALMLVGVLMVSTFRYPSFKSLDLRQRWSYRMALSDRCRSARDRLRPADLLPQRGAHLYLLAAARLATGECRTEAPGQESAQGRESTQLSLVALVEPGSLLGQSLCEVLQREKYLDLQLLGTEEEEFGTLTAVRDEVAPVQPLSVEALAAADLAIFCGSGAQQRQAIELLPETTPAIIVASDFDYPNGALQVWGLETGDASARVVVSPHPVVVLLAHLLSALAEHDPTRLSGTILLPVSTYGNAALDELFEQTRSILTFSDEKPRDVLGQQLAFNLLPAPFAPELGPQVRQVIERDVEVGVDLLLAPVFHGMAASLLIETSMASSTDRVEGTLDSSPFIELTEATEPALGPIDSAGRDEILVATGTPGSRPPRRHQDLGGDGQPDPGLYHQCRRPGAPGAIRGRRLRR